MISANQRVFLVKLELERYQANLVFVIRVMFFIVIVLPQKRMVPVLEAVVFLKTPGLVIFRRIL